MGKIPNKDSSTDYVLLGNCFKMSLIKFERAVQSFALMTSVVRL